MIFDFFVTIILFEKAKTNKTKAKKIIRKKLLFTGSNGPPCCGILRYKNFNFQGSFYCNCFIRYYCNQKCIQYSLRREKCPKTVFFLVRIHTECGKIWTRKTLYLSTFHLVTPNIYNRAFS